ncbi:MAG TPA: glycogen synthase GlgA [Burkholderiales bacterium]|nr:glycogen synthase GlgA [Burkholderiales bacterium]
MISGDAPRVLFVTPECAPLAQVGGLGDVSAALPPALRAVGTDARVLMPGYRRVLASLHALEPIARFSALEPPREAVLLEGRLPTGVPVYVLDHAPLYDRDGDPYQDVLRRDWPDNALRFALLSHVAAQLGGADSPLAWQPHVVHLNDWPAGLAAAYLHYMPQRRAASVFTAHNLAFQGNFDAGLRSGLALPPESYAPEGLEFYGQVSFLKAGLFFADAITTVSPTYSREFQTEPFGAGMHGVLQKRRGVLHGILNGIDTAVWDPATDPHLPVRYSRDTLDAKRHVKRALQQRLSLPVAPQDVPLIGMVGRLTHQKGIDLVLEAVPHLAEMAQLALVGAGAPEHEDALCGVAARFPQRIGVVIGFDEALAHLIEGGADMFLMPSRFEPCGLNQMYSQRYGTPPIAHATGGLADTIVDCTPATLAAGTATGFLFTAPRVDALQEAIARACAVYRASDAWHRLQRNGMARDFSWAGPARAYAALYRSLVRQRARG